MYEPVITILKQHNINPVRQTLVTIGGNKTIGLEIDEPGIMAATRKAEIESMLSGMNCLIDILPNKGVIQIRAKK